MGIRGKCRRDRSRLGLVVTCAAGPIFVNLSGYIRLDPPFFLFETLRNPLRGKKAIGLLGIVCVLGVVRVDGELFVSCRILDCRCLRMKSAVHTSRKKKKKEKERFTNRNFDLSFKILGILKNIVGRVDSM